MQTSELASGANGLLFVSTEEFQEQESLVRTKDEKRQLTMKFWIEFGVWHVNTPLASWQQGPAEVVNCTTLPNPKELAAVYGLFYLQHYSSQQENNKIQKNRKIETLTKNKLTTRTCNSIRCKNPTTRASNPFHSLIQTPHIISSGKDMNVPRPSHGSLSPSCRKEES